MQLKPVEEQVVAVVGASSGIGREAALRFARRGAKVVVSARGESGLRSLVDEIRSEGGEAVAVVADVAEFDQVKAIADSAAGEYGRLDTWAHLASVSLFAPLEEITPEEFKRVVEVDLMGQVYGAMAALPHLKREGWPIGVTNVLPASINTPFFDKSRTKLGYRPMSIPPFYPPGVVAEALLYAAENAPRDLVVGGAGKALLLTQRISPRLMDAVMLYTGFRWQQTDEPKPEEAPDYLFGPVEGDDRIEGDLGKWSFSRSLSTWLDTHPSAKRGAVVGAALLALATLRAKR